MAPELLDVTHSVNDRLDPVTIRLGLDVLDDPELDFSSARIVDGRFLMDGWVDIRGLVPTARGRAKHRVVLSVEAVRSFAFVDEAGTGTLIPEEITTDEHHMHITGVIPAALTLLTDRRTEATFEVEEAPFEVRRRLRWVSV